MLVKGRALIILGVDDNGEHGRIRANCPLNRIEEESRADSAS
jgi:hypothetical protein